MTVQPVATDQSEGRRATKRQLADGINRLNYLGKPLLVEFAHPEFGQTMSVAAIPQPCDGDTFDALWAHELADNLYHYQVTRVVLPGTPEALNFSMTGAMISPTGVSCPLPAKGTSLSSRQFARTKANKLISATLTQNGARFSGKLIDFSAMSLCVEVAIDQPNHRYWVALERQVYTVLESNGELIYAGDMSIVRHTLGTDSQLLVLKPVDTITPRYAKKQYRPLRLNFFPEPVLIFDHPIGGGICKLNLLDLSGLGFCAEESAEHACLLPGMVIPEARVDFGAGGQVPCKIQVVYQTPPDKDDRIKCGVAILDIDIQDHLRLLSILQRARNRNSYLNSEIEPDQLWEFFFETGFIYPSKYQQLAGRKDGFSTTFRKTYLEQTPIARHFTFHSGGHIQAHVSAVRLYEQTWFQQHHAARRVGKHPVGFEVIIQLAEYFYSAFYLSPDKIGYVAGVYRPENRFPAKYFSEIVRVLDNPDAASLDYFSFFSQVPDLPGEWLWAKTPPVWEVKKATPDDLFDFEGYYNKVSSGCLAKALDLTPQTFERKALEDEYSKLGLTRIRHLYAIRKNGVLRALLDLHQADTGLSLSRVDRAVLAFVLDNEIPPNLLFTIIRGLTSKLELDAPPLMVYPREYATAHGVDADKQYDMMILNVAHGEEYMQFLDAYSAQHHKKGT